LLVSAAETEFEAIEGAYGTATVAFVLQGAARQAIGMVAAPARVRTAARRSERDATRGGPTPARSCGRDGREPTPAASSAGGAPAAEGTHRGPDAATGAGPTRHRGARGRHGARGGVAAARQGSLQLLVGGQTEIVARHQNLLEILGSPGPVRHVGGYGAGYTAKLLINLLWFGQAVATGEALLLGRASGLDLGVLREVLADSAAGSDFIRHDLDALFAGDFMRSFGLDRSCEELQTVTALARDHHLPFQVSESVAELYPAGPAPLRAGGRGTAGHRAARRASPPPATAPASRRRTR
jgi:hypothetical protein